MTVDVPAELVHGDIIAHELSDDCWCGPTCVPIECDDGAIEWQYVHHALDGRR